MPPTGADAALARTFVRRPRSWPGLLQALDFFLEVTKGPLTNCSLLWPSTNGRRSRVVVVEPVWLWASIVQAASRSRRNWTGFRQGDAHHPPPWVCGPAPNVRRSLQRNGTTRASREMSTRASSLR